MTKVMSKFVLNEITSPYRVQSVMFSTIEKILSKDTEYEIFSSYSLRRTIGIYMQEISGQIVNHMKETGLSLAKNEFKNFDPQKTKLPQEIIDSLWMETSKFIEEQVQKEGSSEIPGFKELIEELIEEDEVGIRGGKEIGRMDLAEREEFIARLLERVEKVNAKDILLINFKNEFFNFYAKEFGLFRESAQETRAEQRMNRK